MVATTILPNPRVNSILKLVAPPPGVFYFQKDKGKGIRLALLNKLMETLNLMMLIHNHQRLL